MVKTNHILALADTIEAIVEEEELPVAMTACLLVVVQIAQRAGLDKKQIAKSLKASATAVLKAF